MKFNLKSWRHERKLTLFFTLLSLVTIFIVIITTYLLYKHFMEIVIEDNVQNISTFNNSMSEVLLQSYIEDEKNNTDKNFLNMVKRLQTTGVLKYAFVINRQKDEIIWSYDKALADKGASVDTLERKLLELQVGESVQEIRKYYNDKILLRFAFVTGSKQSAEMDIILMQLYLSFFLFVLFAIASSMLLGKALKKPLDKLTFGIKKFGEGNFEYRIQKTPFIELNQIVDSYNKMASELDTLYNDLEEKVVERTVALEKANIELKETQSMMVHSEKMRSLGELVAGIAHEINNPINFIYGNMVHFENYVKDIFSLIEKYEEVEGKLTPNDLKLIEEYKKEIDIDFIKSDILDIIKSCRDGADRTKNIIADLKNFSRLDETTLTEFDIPKEIDTTLNILHNKIKNRIEVIKNYSPDLPKIEAYGRQLNQVFMNILDNAVYAIDSAGTIKINAYPDADKKNVIIEFEDSGKGIKEEDLKKVFEPFYTTKPVGEGTGLGMSIAYKVITSHNGYANVQSEVGIGTKFTIVLPINQKKDEK